MAGTRGVESTLELDGLRDLAHSAVLWARVQGVTRIEAGEPVYDLCLEKNHNFMRITS